MYTLKGIFPEPKKEQKKNFIRENMKQLKLIQGKSPKEPRYIVKTPPASRLSNPIATADPVGHAKPSPSNKSAQASLAVGKTNSRKKIQDVRIKKGDMAEFLKRKKMRNINNNNPEDESQDEADKSSQSSGQQRDIGCQTIESNLSQIFTENTKLTMVYPKKEDDESKMKASGDSSRIKNSPTSHYPYRTEDEELATDRNRSRLNAILERKNNKDPYLPSGYQKGVLPKYLRERKEQAAKDVDGARADEESAACPPGHVALPDNERKETLKMLRNSFAELISELNKLPVKTDTLRMRNKKMELERQLAKLEEGIKVFSRPKVFVKISD